MSVQPILITLAILAIPLAQARAEIQDTTGSLRAGSLSLAAEFQAGLRDGNPMIVNLHESVGLSSGWDLYLRQGLGLNNQGFYLGGGVKWTLLHASSRASRPGVALWLGGHGRTGGGGAGADATIAADYPFGRVRPYIGIDSNLEFHNEVELVLTLFGGARIGIATNISWFVEGGLGIIGSHHFISTGPRIHI